MTFSEILNQYIEELGSSARRLAGTCGCSEAALSRYRNGHRLPDEAALRRLAAGIARLAAERQLTALSWERVYDELSQASQKAGENFPYEILRVRLSLLVRELDIRLGELALYCSIDKSFLSRICSGKRRPHEPEWVIDRVSRYVVHSYTGEGDRRRVFALIGYHSTCSADEDAYREMLAAWLSGKKRTGKTAVFTPPEHHAVFAPEEFFCARLFGTEALLPFPLSFPSIKSYHGTPGMEQGLVEFLQATVSAKSRQDIVLYGDHPMEHCLGSPEFLGQWMQGMAALLRKGLHVHVIHHIGRPFSELLPGLEAWLPLYMTGRLSGYYLDGPKEKLFSHLLLVSGGATFSGNVMPDCPESGHYTLCRTGTDVACGRFRANHLLRHSHLLMDICEESCAEALERLLQQEMASSAPCRRLLTAPPVHTISDHLLEKLLARSHITPDMAEPIRAYVRASRKRIRHLLKRSTLEEIISLWSPEEYTRAPVPLSLIYLSGGTDVYYSYEEYREHLRETEAFAAHCKGYQLTFDRTPCLRNIQITLRPGEYAVISRNRAPNLHLVLHHPRLLEAIGRLMDSKKPERMFRL
ncbi:helix-turn-helix domain-containing protein [Lachnoclostridium sp. Marseille-P6806]|uniref:helix-turn-helix domain-containing protein n=1 Tax=Lachnoclostridium sp. Marseille-P6806 TaxID=2364793 RepID=UPI0010311B39|nr:helix-turn-helix transcriptional regulator [Lachnoclostridium sp. Marseille-P6806]